MGFISAERTSLLVESSYEFVAIVGGCGDGDFVVAVVVAVACEGAGVWWVGDYFY